jgi:radical SAM protein with 4Fe4S-binding SPASM domain
MWNGLLTDPAQLAALHEFMIRGGVERWTISYPYFVRDFISSSMQAADGMPSYADIVDAARHLVDLHERAGRPFHLSIPLIVKHELLDEGFSVSSNTGHDHPCFPCHGSYFVIGPEGDLFDCLLLSRSTSSVRDGRPIWEAGLAAAKHNPFYALTVDDTTADCVGCRYENLCHGQCASDRANTHPSLDGKTFGRDKSACSLLPLAEARIWSQGPKDVQVAIARRLNPDGFVPARWSTPHGIVTFAEPTTRDQMPNDVDLPLIDHALIRSVSPDRPNVAMTGFGAVERQPVPRRTTARPVFHQGLPARLRVTQYGSDKQFK